MDGIAPDEGLVVAFFFDFGSFFPFPLSCALGVFGTTGGLAGVAQGMAGDG